jgi:hypothetical protein
MKPQFDETLLQDLDSFIKYYEFIDAEKVYTNGSELIQVSRIKQWFTYNNKQKQLEEKNKTFEDYNKDLNRQIDKLEEDLDAEKSINSYLSRRILKAIEYLEHEQFKRTILGFGRDKYLNAIKNKTIEILKGEE